MIERVRAAVLEAAADLLVEGGVAAVSMEAIAAREAGMAVLGISLVTNLAAGISGDALSHEEVLEAGREAGPRISRLLADIVGRL